jgi:hypothetical protein
VGINAVRTGIGAGRTIQFVYRIRPGYRLGVQFINGFSAAETFIVEIGKTDRANLGTITASGALFKINVAGGLR